MFGSNVLCNQERKSISTLRPVLVHLRQHGFASSHLIRRTEDGKVISHFSNIDNGRLSLLLYHTLARSFSLSAKR